MSNFDSLNDKYAIGDAVRLAAGPGDLPQVEVDNELSRAEICLHGGHVRCWGRQNERPVLWESAASRFALGAPIRGGIPVCWPWFGAHPTDADQPAHGFARVLPWELRATRALPRGHQVVLGLTDSEATRSMWPHAFDLELEVTVGHQLHVSLRATNLSEESMGFTAALHSYFAVSDVASIAVRGLADTDYIDTVGGARNRHTQLGAIQVREETDRIYLDTDTECFVDDPGWQRCLRIGKQGSRTTVVWNPWVAKSQRMPDFGDHEYPEMLCVETANAENDARILAAGASAVLGTVISVEPLTGGNA